MAELPGFLQSAIGKVGEIILWTREKLEDDAVRRATLLDLGMDPETDIEFPDNPTSNIEAYQKAVNPDQAAFDSAVEDIKSFYRIMKSTIGTIRNGRHPDENLWNLLELLSINYLRFREPVLFYAAQIGGLLYENPLTAGTSQEKEGIVLDNVWGLLTNPVGYIKNFLLFFTHPSLPGLDTTEDAEAWSGLFMAVSGLMLALKKAGILSEEAHFLYGWDVLPQNFSDERKKELQDSFHGDKLLERLKKSQPDEFSSNLSKVEGWKKIDEILAGPKHLKIYREVNAAYQTAIERWRRGGFADMISETAFSFDYPIDGGIDGSKQQLGATMFWVSREDAPADLQKNQAVQFEPSGGLFISINGAAKIKKSISDKWSWTLALESGNLLDVYLDRAADANVMGDLAIKLALISKPDKATDATYNLPNADGTRLAIGEISLKAFLGRGDRGLELGLKNNALVIGGRDGDGFLSEILPEDDIAMSFSLAAGYSKRKGFYFNQNLSDLDELADVKDLVKDIGELVNPIGDRGLTARDVPTAPSANVHSQALEAVFPINKKLGLLEFESVHWDYGPVSKTGFLGAYLRVLTTLSSKIGPVFLRIEKIGSKISFTMPEAGGDLSQTEFDYGFEPPQGVAIRVDAGVLSGGGFLRFEPKQHRYSGAVALEFLEIELSAIGLINTRLPNGEKGFSMLLSISTLFNPAYILPYNFRLKGVGGIIGVHRTMKVEVLRQRILDGAINNLMFPKNVIANAPQIISDLRAIFPPQKKHYVVAPFVRVTWGVPEVIEVDLGIFLEFPFKGRLILLGKVGIYLPSRESSRRIAEMHIDIFGDLNFSESYVLIEGRIRDAQVQGIPLTGGFAFVLDWGRQRQFLLSLGGYHPRYQKPDRFPVLPRLAAKIQMKDNISMTCEYYQAITSNSYQIGFSARMVVRKGAARATGTLAFNALLQFDPFLFEAEIYISADISYKGRSFAGIELYFLLSGPKPWRAKGFARISLWLFSLKLKFDYSWGGEQEVARSFIEPEELLRQLSTATNFSVRFADQFAPAVTLRSVNDAASRGSLLIHPAGRLEMRQNLLPLNRTIEKQGNSYVRHQPVFKVFSYQLGQQAAVNQVDEELREYFSRGQFEELTDSEKIAARDFELLPTGIALNEGEAFDLPREMAATASDFEDIIFSPDDNVILEARGANWQFDSRRIELNHDKNFHSSHPEERFVLAEQLPEYEEPTFQILSKDELDVPEQLGAHQFRTKSEAKDYLKQKLRLERSLYQVVRL